MSAQELLLDVRNVVVEYGSARGGTRVRALDNVSITIGSCETLGLVGESGSGKSTLGRAVLGMTPVQSGSVHFSGEDITHASERRRRDLSTQLQVIFQNPYSSLNPTRTVGQTLTESLLMQRDQSKAERASRVAAMLTRVGLSADAANRYPGRFSGGQRQRIAIARALMAQPRLVICDEPVSALDLSVQAQVMNLLRELQDELRLSYLFIAHDLDVVRHISDRIAVIQGGKIMETGETSTVYEHPTSPYTKLLLDAAPVPDPLRQRQRREARHAMRDAATAGSLRSKPSGVEQ